MQILRRLMMRTAPLAARTLRAGGVPLGLALSVMPVAAGQTADKSMTVFVTASEGAAQGKATEADRQQAAAAMKAAQNTRKELDANLKAQFGNKRDKWPADARERYADAEEAELRLNTDWLYRSGGSAPLPRNVPDLTQAIEGGGLAGKKDHVVDVGTREEAQLIVELNAVRTANTADADP